MLTLRPYQPEDADIIVSWIRDRETMHRLAANLYDTFPVTGEMMNRAYDNYKATHKMIALTVLDESGAVCGHFSYLFREDDPDKEAVISWRGHSNVFFTNWLNVVYQVTPFDLDELEDLEW